MEKSELIKKWREHLGYSQQKLADVLNVQRHTVTNWEKGNSQPYAANLRKIAQAAGVEYETFLNGPKETDYDIRTILDENILRAIITEANRRGISEKNLISAALVYYLLTKEEQRILAGRELETYRLFLENPDTQAIPEQSKIRLSEVFQVPAK